MTHPYDLLETEQGYSFLFTPCPGTKDAGLTNSVATLKEAGATALITLMPKEEMASFDAQTLPDVCQGLDLHWFHLPITDDAAPDGCFHATFEQQKPEIFELLKQQQTIAIHCRGGSGRTGFMAAILLLELGLSWAEVKNLVQGLRPKALTKQAHLDYLKATYQIEL